MSEGTRARGRLTPAPFAIPRDGGSIPPISTTWPRWFSGRRRARPLCGLAACMASLDGPGRCVCRCAKKFAQHGLIVGLCAKKFALRARNTPNLTFLRLLGEFCRGLSGGGAVPGEFCRVCRPCHRPRNSPWPDTTPALPPSPEQFLARHYPGPAAAHRHRGLARRHSNFACNSPAACSNIEFASLELQRFLGLLKFGSIELHAKFVWRWPCEPVLALPTGCLHRGRALRPLRRFPDRWCLVCCVGLLDLCRAFGTKFSLLGFLVVTTV